MKTIKLDKKQIMILTIAIIVITTFSVTLTVKSSERISAKQRNMYERESVKTQVQTVRKYLDESGFRNSGVTITRVTEDEKNSYTLTIHHGKLKQLDDYKKDVLVSEIKDLTDTTVVGDMQVCFLE